MVIPPPQEPLTIRGANDNDVASISKLGTYVFSLTFGHSVRPHELQAYLEECYSVAAIAKDMSNPDKDTIVATNNQDQVVGFALLTKGTTEPCISHISNCVELQRLYVHPSLHGKGVGRKLASAMEDMAVEQGFEYIWLGVWEENLKAQKLYQKLGYTLVGQHDFNLGGDIQTDQVMLKELKRK